MGKIRLLMKKKRLHRKPVDDTVPDYFRDRHYVYQEEKDAKAPYLQGKTKVCPYCGRTIRAAAHVCPRCMHVLDKVSGNDGL